MTQWSKNKIAPFVVFPGDKRPRKARENINQLLQPGQPSQDVVLAAVQSLLSSLNRPQSVTEHSKTVRGHRSARRCRTQSGSKSSSPTSSHKDSAGEDSNSSNHKDSISPRSTASKKSLKSPTHSSLSASPIRQNQPTALTQGAKVNKVFRTCCQRITDAELIKILKNAENGLHDKYIMEGPAVRPKGGEMFLYRCKKLKDFDYRRDQHTGLRSRGTNEKNENTELHRWYFKLLDTQNKAIDGFQRDEVCLRESLNRTNKVIAVMYTGDHKLWEPRPHLNSKSGKFFTANTAQAKDDIKTKLTVTSKKSQASYEDLGKEVASRPDYPAREAVIGPRDRKQVENVKHKLDKEKRLFRDEFFSAFEMARCQRIGNFMKFFLTPNESFVLAEPEMLRLANALLHQAQQDPSTPQVLVYDTTFCLCDSYVSTLVMKNTFLQGDPITPIIFLMHENKRFENHDVLWREITELLPVNPLPEFVPICCDRESAIVKAIRHHLGDDVNLVFCNNHIKRDAKDWVSRCKGKTHADVTVLTAEIDSLLRTESEDEFEMQFETLEATWSQEFKEYVNNHLKSDMKTHAAYFYTSKFPAFKSFDATNNAVESLNAILKRLTDWKTLRVDSIILYLFNLQLSYLKEFAKAYEDTGIGQHVLKASQKFSKCPFKVPLHANWKEEQFIEAFREGIYKPGQNVEKEPNYLQSRSAIAKIACQLQYVSLNSQTLSYTITDPYNGKRDLVEEDDGKLICTCQSTGVCFHKLAYLHVTQKELIEDRCSWSLSVLKKRTRGFKGRSGKKKPTVDDFVDVEPAPDSDIAKKRSELDSELSEEEDVYVSDRQNKRATTRAFPVQTVTTKVSPTTTRTPKDSQWDFANEIGDEDVEEQAGLHNYSNLAHIPSDGKFDASDSVSTSSDGTTPLEFKFSTNLPPLPASVYRRPGLKCLLPGQELMGDIVDDMIALLIRCHGLDDRICFLNSYIFRTAVSAITSDDSKLNLLAYAVRTEVVNSDIALVNVHVQNPHHYLLAVIVYPRKEVVIINSAPGCPDNTQILKQALLMITASSFAVAGAKFDCNQWNFVLETSAALQIGGIDCGVYTIMNAYSIITKKDFFTSENFPDIVKIRLWIARCLTNEKVTRPVALRTFKICRRMQRSERQGILGILKASECHLQAIRHEGTMYETRGREIRRLMRVKDLPDQQCSQSDCTPAKASEARRHVMCVQCRLWYHAETCVHAPVSATFFLCQNCLPVSPDIERI